jgi:hypothetical protein
LKLEKYSFGMGERYYGALRKFEFETALTIATYDQDNEIIA